MKALLAFCFLSLVSPLALFSQPAAWEPVQGLGLGERKSDFSLAAAARLAPSSG